MHFGQVKRAIRFSPRVTFFIIATALLFGSCKRDKTAADSISFRYPEQGQLFALGDDINVALAIPQGKTVASITYSLDGKVSVTKPNADSLLISSKGLAVGYKLITAVVDYGSEKDTITTNIILKSGTKPSLYSYKVVNVLPHDTSAYTQGLEYHNGKFLESTGLEGSSTLRWVNVNTGKPIKMVKIDKQYFGEGVTLVGDKIVMLTWQGNIGFVFDAATLVQKGTFPYQSSREGWGLCYDGTRIIKSDGTNRIYFLNKDSYKEELTIEVYDDQGPVEMINELEYIEGKIYANIYTKDYLVVIDPETGIVEKKIDLSGLLAKGYTRTMVDGNIDVLNGIAWDKQSKRLFVTGKKWPRLFEIKLAPH
ncbi:MAG: glutaminyl-peptide cyclotransferase [Bacteroidota bacterium]